MTRGLFLPWYFVCNGGGGEEVRGNWIEWKHSINESMENCQGCRTRLFVFNCNNISRWLYSSHCSLISFTDCRTWTISDKKWRFSTSSGVWLLPRYMFLCSVFSPTYSISWTGNNLTFEIVQVWLIVLLSLSVNFVRKRSLLFDINLYSHSTS